MRELTDKELYQALQYAKSLDETAGQTILQQFQTDQTAFAQTIFGVFPSVIAERDQNMAHLFMDLCFDVICVFKHAFGALPDQRSMGMDWLEKLATLLDTELQAFMPGNQLDEKFRTKLQDRFTDRLINSNSQAGLVKFMDESISEFVSENTADAQAVRTTRTMIFVVIQLFCILYDQTTMAA
jgi:hypothetical protein